MRAASGGKFSLGSAFGRKTERKPSYSGNDFGQPDSPSVGGFGSNGNGNGQGSAHPGYHGNHYGNNNGNGNTSDDPGSPGVTGGGATFDGFGKKLGKTFAHQSLLPSLGNKDQRALQDVISAEKGVLNTVDRLANESSKAATALSPYGLQEGPDLHDILTQSSTLLSHLSSALLVFSERQGLLRAAYKRIREREEALSDLRSRRRTTGSKAETAEKKLAKMGPENKQLPQQTELLEMLRGQMRGMDTEIVNEESRIGDFKRQSVKEALSYKFAGLEELGEKLCIIGELGKLVIEEIPLDETPAGYGRAPYNGFAKTESAVDEAGRCLSQVKFNPVNFELKASHLPRTSHTLGRERLPGQESLAAAEEYGNVPPAGHAGVPGAGTGYGNSAPPPAGAGGTGTGAGGHHVNFALDDNPYGGLDGRYGSDNNAYREYGGLRSDATDGARPGQGQGQVVWQGPTEEALARQNGPDSDYRRNSRERVASLVGSGLGQTQGQIPASRGPSLGPVAAVGAAAVGGHDYEYAQQAEMDRQQREERAAWREQATQPDRADQQQPQHPQQQRELAIGEVMRNPYDAPAGPPPDHLSASRTAPLNIRPRGTSPAAATSHLPGADAPGNVVNEYNYGSEGHGQDRGADSGNADEPLVTPGLAAAINALAPPPSFSQMGHGRSSPGIDRDSGTEGFRTPAESPAAIPTETIGGDAFPLVSEPSQAATAPGSGQAGHAGQTGTGVGVPVIALAPQFEGEGGDDTNNISVPAPAPAPSGGAGYEAPRGTSPLPPVPSIQDPASAHPYARGPSPRPLPEPGAAGSAHTSPVVSTPYSPNAVSGAGAGSATGTGGKISAGAFRKPQPRRSDTDGSAAGEGSRRLPVPPGGFAGAAGGAAAPAGLGQGWADEKRVLNEQLRRAEQGDTASAGLAQGQVQGQGQGYAYAQGQGQQGQQGHFVDAPADAPPGYVRDHRDSRGEDSLR